MIDISAVSARSFSPYLPTIDFVRDDYVKRPKIGSAKTREGYIDDARKLNLYWCEHWCPANRLPVRAIRLCDFSEELIVAAMQWHSAQRRCKVNTANKFRRQMLAVWRYAADLSIVANRRNPRLPVIAPPNRVLCHAYTEPVIEPECWSMEELGRIFDVVAKLRGRLNKEVTKSAWHSAHLWTVYNTGVRIDALMRTPLANLDLRRGEIKIPAGVQKDKAEQRFDLLPETIDALRRLRLHERMPADRPVFADWPHDPAPGAWHTLTKRLREFVLAAGFECTPRDLFHKLRRTFATYLARDQGIVAAQQWLGHSHISTTWRYIDKRYYDGPRLNGSLPSPRPLSDQVQLNLRIFAGDADVG